MFSRRFVKSFQQLILLVLLKITTFQGTGNDSMNRVKYISQDFILLGGKSALKAPQCVTIDPPQSFVVCSFR